MRRTSNAVGSACLTVLLAACTQATAPSGLSQSTVISEGKRQVVGEAIFEQLSGKRFQWIRARDQASGETTFAKDGSMSWRRLDVASSGKGRWTVEGDRICQKFDPTPQWKGGRVCRKLYRKGNTLTTSPNDGGLVTYNEIPAT